MSRIYYHGIFFMTKPTTHPATISLCMPDGTLVELDIRFTASYEKNPFDIDPAHYDGSDDGWQVDDIELV